MIKSILSRVGRSTRRRVQRELSYGSSEKLKQKWSMEEETHHEMPAASEIIDEDLIHEMMETTVEKAKDVGRVLEVLESARDRALLKEVSKKDISSEYFQGLSLEETAILLNVDENDEYLMGELFATAGSIKDKIYGNRVVLFAPLYCSNFCTGSCLYCGYRAKNKNIKRSVLSDEELVAEVVALESMGHKRLMMLCGEADNYTFQDFCDHLELAASVESGEHGEIRRINVEIPQLSVSDFRKLKATGCVGTYVNFMETYHRETYEKMHPKFGKNPPMKCDYDDRLTVMHRSLIAGLDDVGIGALYGLYDYRFEVLALLQHAQHLDKMFGTGPHTISVPRMCSASGSEVSEAPPYEVNDQEFKKIVAIIRCMVPYTGIILTTRESLEMRNELMDLGISQMSAGSKTDIGSYKKGEEEHKEEDEGQFALGDHRPTEEVIVDLLENNYIPSWCTACYRKGRTGPVFMSIAKRGEIHNMCHPNAILTLQEYLLDYASPETQKLGFELIEREILNVTDVNRRKALVKALKKQHEGERDLHF